jgi:cysteine dioxygenase
MPIAQYDPLTYKRSLLYNDNNIDVYLIGWSANQASRIHDHPDNGCVLRVLRNEVSEETYIRRDAGIEKLSHKNLKVGETGHIKKNTILHRIINETNEKTLSLHVYSPPNYKTRYYDEKGGLLP